MAVLDFEGLFQNKGFYDSNDWLSPADISLGDLPSPSQCSHLQVSLAGFPPSCLLSSRKRRKRNILRYWHQ